MAMDSNMESNETDPLLKSGSDQFRFVDNDDGFSISTSATALQRRLSMIVTTVSEAATGVVEQVQEAAAEVADTFTDEMHDVQDALMDELHEADDGNTYFTEMALVRSLSILPRDFVQAAQTVHDQAVLYQKQQDGSLDDAVILPLKDSATTTVQLRIPPSAYIGLASAVVSLSAIGPLLAKQQNVTGTMKILWRMLGTTIALTPIAIRNITAWPRLTMAQWMTFLLATISYVTMGVAFVLALPYTSVGTAVILANSQAVMLLLGNLFVGEPVTLQEGVGAFAAFGGAVMCSQDAANSQDTTSDALSTLWGDFLALVAGIGGCGYLIFAKTVRQHMNLYVFTFLTMAVGCFVCLFLQIVVLHEVVTFDRHPNTGVFGFLTLQMDRLPLELVMVLVCNICGTMGYVRAMAFFDTLIISVAGLMEPVIAEFIALIMGVGVLPGWMGWVGNLFVAAGTLAVVLPTPRNMSSGH